jgi:hypothetical protein
MPSEKEIVRLWFRQIKIPLGLETRFELANPCIAGEKFKINVKADACKRMFAPVDKCRIGAQNESKDSGKQLNLHGFSRVSRLLASA